MPFPTYYSMPENRRLFIIVRYVRYLPNYFINQYSPARLYQKCVSRYGTGNVYLGGYCCNHAWLYGADGTATQHVTHVVAAPEQQQPVAVQISRVLAGQLGQVPGLILAPRLVTVLFLLLLGQMHMYCQILESALCEPFLYRNILEFDVFNSGSTRHESNSTIVIKGLNL